MCIRDRFMTSFLSVDAVGVRCSNTRHDGKKLARAPWGVSPNPHALHAVHADGSRDTAHTRQVPAQRRCSHLRERETFDLAHALARQTELRADLLECSCGVSSDAEAHPEDRLLAGIELTEHRPDALLNLALRGVFERTDGLFVPHGLRHVVD